MTESYCRKSIAKMAGYTPGEQPQDRTYIKLNTNENPYPPSPAVSKALAGMDPARLKLYPDPVATALRQAAGAPLGFDPDWVLCGNGSDDLLTIAARTFVGEGEQLACPTPTYSLYPVLAQLQGAKLVEVELDNAFELPADFAARIAGCRLVFVARPNAPTGNAFPLAAMHQLCESFEGIVWIDEAYADFADDNCLVFAREYDNVVVSRTLSKSYSLAGVRLGLAYANPDLVREMVKVKDSYNVNLVTQLLAIAALGDQQHMARNADRIRATRRRTSETLEMLGFQVLPSAANFIFTAPPMPAADYAAALREAGILVRYFPGPRTGDFVRITIGTDAEITALLDATRAILSC